MAGVRLWLVSGCGWRLTAGRFVNARRSMLRGFVRALLGLARPVFGFHLQVQEPDRHPEDLLQASSDVPLLVMARHAGPGASFALVHLLLTRFGRKLHVVLKDTLRLDPAIDLLLTRTGCTWIPAQRTDPMSPPGGSVRRPPAYTAGRPSCCSPKGRIGPRCGTSPRSPNCTSVGSSAKPSRPCGCNTSCHPGPPEPWQRCQGARNADVLIFTHIRHDDLLNAASAWQALPLTRPLQMAWWRAPAHSLPSHAPDQVNNWLHDTWVKIDAWIADLVALFGLVHADPRCLRVAGTLMSGC